MDLKGKLIIDTFYPECSHIAYNTLKRTSNLHL